MNQLTRIKKSRKPTTAWAVDGKKLVKDSEAALASPIQRKSPKEKPLELPLEQITAGKRVRKKTPLHWSAVQAHLLSDSPARQAAPITTRNVSTLPKTQFKGTRSQTTAITTNANLAHSPTPNKKRKRNDTNLEDPQNKKQKTYEDTTVSAWSSQVSRSLDNYLSSSKRRLSSKL